MSCYVPVMLRHLAMHTAAEVSSGNVIEGQLSAHSCLDRATHLRLSFDRLPVQAVHDRRRPGVDANQSSTMMKFPAVLHRMSLVAAGTAVLRTQGSDTDDCIQADGDRPVGCSPSASKPDLHQNLLGMLVPGTDSITWCALFIGPEVAAALLRFAGARRLATAVHAVVPDRGVVVRTDRKPVQRRTRFVDQNQVDLVDDGETGAAPARPRTMLSRR